MTNVNLGPSGILGSDGKQNAPSVSAVFLYCRFSLFLKDPFSPDYLEVATAVVVRHGVGKTSPHTSIKC